MLCGWFLFKETDSVMNKHKIPFHLLWADNFLELKDVFDKHGKIL